MQGVMYTINLSIMQSNRIGEEMLVELKKLNRKREAADVKEDSTAKRIRKDDHDDHDDDDKQGEPAKATDPVDAIPCGAATNSG